MARRLLQRLRAVWICAILAPALQGSVLHGQDAATQAKIDAAIEKGVAYLWTRQQGDGSWAFNIHQGKVDHPLALTAMATYALMETGVHPQEPRLRKALDWLREAARDPKYQPGADSTYSLGFRCQAWMIANAKTNDRYLRIMERDVDQIVRSTPRGDYDYLCSGTPRYVTAGRPDNSNSQYALYGVWAGKVNYVSIPKEYWEKVLQYWMRSQKSDGGWSYTNNDPETRITMAAAGVASLFVCFDALYGPYYLEVGRKPPDIVRAIEKGLDYLDKRFEASLKDPARYRVDGWYMYYHLFGIQRVALAAERKRFINADWYDLGAKVLLRRQADNGSRPGIERLPSEVLTSYALMFLARGSRPLPFVRLNYGEGWNNRPHAAAHLLRWMGGQLEQSYRTQSVDFNCPETDWKDSRILLISGHKAPSLTEQQTDRLRRYVQQGGMLFSCAEGAGFSDGMREIYEKAFPLRVLVPLGKGHPVNSIHYPLNGQIRFWGVTDGKRTLALHTDADLPGRWQKNDWQNDPQAFQAGANVYLLSRGKSVSKQSERARAALPASSAHSPLDASPAEISRWPGHAQFAQTVRECRTLWNQFGEQQQKGSETAVSDFEKAMQSEVQRLKRFGQTEQAILTQYALDAVRKGEPADFSGIKSPVVRKAKDAYDKAVSGSAEEYESRRMQCRQQYAQKMQAALRDWQATAEASIQAADSARNVAQADDLRKLKAALDAELRAIAEPAP